MVLLHGGGGAEAQWETHRAENIPSKSDLKTSNNSVSTSDSGYICNYCRERGHWKADCPVLKAKSKNTRVVKPAAFVAPVKDSGAFEEPPFQPCDRDALAAFVPFIREGVVSLLGSDGKVLIRILRDTGAYDSYIVDSVLPFSSESDTGDCVLSRGMGLSVLPVPLHKLVLDCDLVKGEVVV